MAKTKNKQQKKSAPKVHLVFDDAKRKEFLSGFHKRKVQRKKDADEKFKKDLLEERKRLKAEARESYKKLVVSHRAIPELETLLADEYEDEDVTVKIQELSTDQIALSNNWIGANRPKYQESEESEPEDDGEEKADDVPGMELDPVKVAKVKEPKATTFKSEKELKKHLKKEATKKVKKSKVFKMKNKLEQRKQKKKSAMMKNERFKIRDKKKRK